MRHASALTTTLLLTTQLSASLPLSWWHNYLHPSSMMVVIRTTHVWHIYLVDFTIESNRNQ